MNQIKTRMVRRGLVDGHIPGGSLPAPVRKATDTWRRFIEPLVKKMEVVWDNPNLRNQQWQEFVERFKNKSFFQVLSEQKFSNADINFFGSMGLGTGGFDSMFPVNFIEILRLSVCKWDIDQRIVKGGVVKIPETFWERHRHCRHWKDMSVETLNNGQPLGTVTRILP